jgi:hypothetical protein
VSTVTADAHVLDRHIAAEFARRDELHRHQDRHGFRGEQPDQHQYLRHARLDRPRAAQQHADVGARERHQADRASLVERRDQRVPGRRAADLQRSRPRQEPQGKRGFVSAGTAEFLFIGAPLNVVGATGAPVRPPAVVGA